jgi:hypothetical protein
MSSDDAWSVPDSGAAPPAPAAAAGPAADPSAPEAAPALVPTLAPATASAMAPGPESGIGTGLGAIRRQQAPEPNRALWPTVAGLFLAAGVTQVVYLFAHSETFVPGQANYELLSIDAFYGLRAVLVFACGALLLTERTRELAGGLALSVSVLSLAFYFASLRPSVINGTADRLARYMGAGATVLLIGAGIVALVAVLRERRRGVVHRRQSRTNRVIAVVAGFLGAVFLLVGECIASYRVELRTQLGEQTVQCCGLSRVSGWSAAELLVGTGVTLVLAVFAATLRSRKFAAGLLFGTTVLPLSNVAQVAALSAAPVQSIYGFNHRFSGFASIGVTSTPLAGFWLALLGLLLLAAAAVARLLLGARKNPYSAQPYAAPGHSAPAP